MTAAARDGEAERLTYGIYAAAAVLYLALAHCFAKQTGDDSFIYYRIADNVLAGHGPVFNPGEHVEAYSSPLWLTLLVGGRGIGCAYGTFSRLLGHVLALLGIGASAATARALGASSKAAALVALFSVLSGSVQYWTPSGLETPLHLLLIALLSFGIASGRRWVYMMTVGLVGVSRPEGMFLVPIAIVAYWVAYGWRALAPAQLLAAALPAAAYEAFRIGYFHSPLANTYYAKATGPLLDRVGQGVDYSFWILVLVVPTSLLALRRWLRQEPRSLAVLLVPGAVIAATIVGGGDWMWGHRLLVPALPPILAVALVELPRALATRPTWLRGAIMVAAPLLALNDDLPWHERLGYEEFFGFNPWNKVLKFKNWGDYGRAAELRFVRPAQTVIGALAGHTIDPGARMEGTMTEVSRDVGVFLAERYASDSLIAVNHAGAVPFYSRLPAVDMTGLADWHIAHDVQGGLHQKYDPAYVLARHPRAIVLNSRVEPGKDGVWYHEGYWDGETALVRHPEFAAHYRALPTFFRWEYCDRKGNYILLYERIEP